MNFHILLYILPLVFFLFIIPTQGSTPFTAKDLHQLGRLSDGAVSSDGEYVAYSVQRWNPETGKTSTNLQCTRISDRKTYDVTESKEGFSDNTPAFSKDFPNFIFFLSNRNGKNQVYFTEFPPVPHSEVFTLTNLPLDVDNLKISRRTLAFTTSVYHECLDIACTVERDAVIAARGSNTYTVYDKMFVSHWDQWDTGKVSHVFFVLLESHLKEDKFYPVLMSAPVDLLISLNTQAPVPPNGGLEQFDISEDGLEIALTGQDRTRDEAWRTDWKIYHMKIAEKWVDLNKVTIDFEGRTQNPRFSPDGKKIGFLAMNRKGSESDSLRLVVYSQLNRNFVKIDHDFDRSIDEFQWMDDNTIFLLATDNGSTKIYYVSLDKSTPKISLVLDDFTSTDSLIKIPRTTNFIAQRNSFTQPADFWLFNLSTMTQITFINSEALSKFDIVTPEIFSFTGGYNDPVQGWVFKPIDFQENKSYPIAFLIHGGPESPWLQSWSYRWNPQLWISRGYAVVMINPHGSPGQGQNFTDAVINNWGGVPFEDLMNGLDYAVNQYSWLNNDKACAIGASYGGYMVNWIQGQTDRFKCLVTHDGVFSTLAMFYETEEIWFPMAEYCPLGEHGCTPWQENYREGFEKFNPERYVKNWKTPHLIIHGSKDYRIPISEGLSAFTALQVRNIPSRFIHFHEENHWVLRRENSIKWYEEVLGWLDAWTAKQELLQKE